MHTRKQVRFHRAVGVIPSTAKFFAKLSLERKPGAKNFAGWRAETPSYLH
jgi:hypothetical protein